MEKTNSKFFTILSLLALSAGFAVLMGCTGEGVNNGPEKRGNNTNNEGKEVDLEPGTFPGLDAKTERRIVEDCGEPVWGIMEYLGAYNGWVVVRVHMPVPGVVQIVTIGGFDFNVLPPIIAWKDGQIHELKDAYDAGLLTQDDIRSIAEYSLEEKE